MESIARAVEVSSEGGSCSKSSGGVAARTGIRGEVGGPLDVGLTSLGTRSDGVELQEQCEWGRAG